MTTLAPPRRRSYSQLDVYLTCPAMYRAKYVDKLPEQPSIWTIGGTAFHSVAEQYLRGDITAADAELFPAWLEAFETAKASEIAKNPLATEDLDKWRAADRGRENADWWIEHGYRMVTRFAKWWPTTGLSVFEDEEGPGLERELEVWLGGVHVIVIPDAIVVDEHGQLDIMDYKSGKPPKKSLQLGVYKAGIAAALGLDVTWGLYYMAREGRLLPVDLHQWPATKIADMFAEFDYRERSGDHDPTPGDHCSFCPLRKTCPASAKK